PRLPKPAVTDVVERTGSVATVTREGVLRTGTGGPMPPGSAFVVWTSGTTGKPKAVVHEHDSYLELIDRVLGTLRSSPSTTRPRPNLIAVSMALNAGIYNALFGLRAGAPLVVMDRFEPLGFASLVTEHDITSTVLPPA